MYRYETDDEDYDIHVGAESSVLAKCRGRFLYACKDCYHMNPRMIAKLGNKGRCPCCSKANKIFLHETTTTNDDDFEFHEYQVIRERRSDHDWANVYCKYRSNCYRGEECRFVHTFLEMVVWRAESHRNPFKHASRGSLARFSTHSANDQYLHCPYCCRNFDKNPDYISHLTTKFHLSLQKWMSGGRDVVWYYKPCPTNPEKCIRSDSEDDCNCSCAHGGREFEEWKKRLSLTKARHSYKEESPSIDYLTLIQERMQTQQISEMRNNSQHKVIDMSEKEALWNTCYKIRKSGPLGISFLQPLFKLKHGDDSRYVQHLRGLHTTSCESLSLSIRFENPRIYGQYSGTLVFDFGSDAPACAATYNVTIKGSKLTDQQDIQSEILTQDLKLNRIVIPYPESKFGKVEYEVRVKELEKRYKVPQSARLEEVYLEDLTPKIYAEKMHNFLYKEESARQSVLSRLNVECELKCESHIYTSVSLLGSKADGSLYGSFETLKRLSADSDEGILVRDSCSKVLVGAKERFSTAYECKIEQWENIQVHISMPARCVSDLNLESGTKKSVLVQFQLDRSKFCLRHYAIDSLDERINMICPQQTLYAKLNYASLDSEDLDDAQNKVLNHIYAVTRKNRFNPSQDCFPPLIAAGPFGTGKTHTIRNVILDLLNRDGTEARILLCTHSNSAADLYIKDIFEDNRWQDWTSVVLRVMYHGRNPRTVLVPEVRNCCLFADARENGFRYPTLSELMKHQIIITTFSTSTALGQLGIGLRDGVFTHIFLDEASQAMEPEAIMPLTLANPRNTRIVIAGDHRQINERLFLLDDVKIPTLLERMYNAYEDHHTQHRVLLCNNYRCVNGLLQLISDLFYKKGILKSAAPDVKLLRGYDSVHFVHVQGECNMTNAGDFVNESEANQAVQQVRELVAAGVVELKDIMVSTPYNSQVRLIRDLLRKNSMREVIVHSARNVQALQFRVVIFSCVLRRVNCVSCAGKNFGFLSDANLLNTVLTRAKSLVVAIGDAVTLCSTGSCQKQWNTFLEHCAGSKTIHPHHVDMSSLRKDISLAKRELKLSASEYVPTAMRNELSSDLPHRECAPQSQESCRQTSTKNSEEKDEEIDDDLILADMVKKSEGLEPYELYPDSDEGNENVQLRGEGDQDYDPNEPDRRRFSNRYVGKEKMYPTHSVGELQEMLESKPELYKRCRIYIKNWYTAEAVELDETGAENHEKVYNLVKKNDLGRTFDQDEVVVENKRIESTNASEHTVSCRVMGVLKRDKDVRQLYFLCRSDEHNSALMCSGEKPHIKFGIKTPKDHKSKNPGKIPIYDVVLKRSNFTELKLVSCEDLNWKCYYAVKYLEWSEYEPFPHGYVEKVIPMEDYQKCLELELGAHMKKPSVINQAKKIKVTASENSEFVQVFTIDPAGAKELDDALSIEDCKEHNDCFLLGIHVTDVASLVAKDSPIDRNARKQGVACYCSGETMHMLPEELSNDKCSLLPGKIRAAISTYFHTSAGPPHTDGNAVVCCVEPKKTFVKSIKQLSYKAAEDMITEGFRHPGRVSLNDKLCNIWDAMWSWRVSRLNGAAYFKDFDSYRELMEEARAHLLVEEAMLAVNANAANYLISKGFDIYLRTQGLPDLELWNKWLSSNRKSIQKSSCLTSNSNYIREEHERKRKFTRVPDSMKDHERISIGSPVSHSFDVENEIVMYEHVWKDIKKCVENGNTDVILFIAAMDFLHPSLAPALEHFHSIQRKSEWISRRGDDTLHCSLRLVRYTRCSSPIRRYRDIVIQRCIHRALEGKAPTKDDTEKVPWNVDDRIKHLQFQYEMAELAKKLREQPVVTMACISMVTDAGVKICLPSHGKFIPSRLKEIDYAHLMVDFDKDSKIHFKGKKEDYSTHAGDEILAEMKTLWRFRFYDYGKFVCEEATRLVHKNVTEESSTVKISAAQWHSLLEVMANPPGWTSSEADKICHKQNVEKVVNQLTPIYHRLIHDDKMCDETRNYPVPVMHHREIRKNLKAGIVFQIQLNGWQGKVGTPEPHLQLLKLADDLEVCVHHNKEALHIFAHGVKGKDHISVESLRHYSKMWEPLIRLDSVYNAVTDGHSLILNGVTISWDFLSPAILGHTFELDAKFCRDRFIEFHPEDLLCLRRRGVANRPEATISLGGTHCTTHTAVLHGSIVKVKDRKHSRVTVSFKIFDQLEQNRSIFENDANQWTIEVIPLSFMHRKMHIAVRQVSNTDNKLIEQIALETVKDRDDVALPGEADYLKHRRKLSGFVFELNDKQLMEKNRSLQQKFTVIQGPPGTGKSYLGALIAASFVRINKLRNPRTPKKVLYCGPSNKAVDVAARFLKDAKDLKVVRMYSGHLEEKEFPNPLKPKLTVQNTRDDLKKPDEKLHNIALHHLIRKGDKTLAREIKKFDTDVKETKKTFTREEIENHKAKVMRAKTDELKNCDVIVCTCSLSPLLAQLKDEDDEVMKFAQCIIDECGMCSEPETMLPLLVSNPKQVVLIGDHEQLQPIIKCKIAERLGLGESLFSKFSHMARMLTVQYRMDKEIMDYPSKAFYKEKLECDKTVKKRPPKQFFQPHITENNIFWNVVGEEQQQKVSSIRGGHKSKFNREEAKAVIQLLVYLTNDSPSKLKPDQIMVLSPYTAQCACIHDMIKKERTQLKDVHVGTIITSQGSEAEFVILSTVRSMDKNRVSESPGLLWEQKHLGFVCDRHQVNVALTRARRGLCIIGNKSLLEANELWREVIKSYNDRGAVYESLFDSGAIQYADLWDCFSDIEDEEQDAEEDSSDSYSTTDDDY